MNNIDEREVVDCLLSTSDNPYNPFDDFIHWYQYDIAKGYNTCAYMARVCETSELSNREERAAYNKAAEEAVLLNLTGNRILVTRPGSLDAQYTS